MAKSSAPVEADNPFAAEILEGLSRPRKQISSKWLYDEAGSRLFEKITGVGEYYPPRIEAEIFEQVYDELADIIPPGNAIVEYGSGASEKSRNLIRALKPSVYVPIDISEDFMVAAAERINAAFPDLAVHPVAGDFLADLPLPAAFTDTRDRLAFFPGSTIGNFEPDTAQAFLRSARKAMGPGSKFLISADLVKPADVLERAYDDSDGVTAAFNLNLLARLNEELGADFDLASFSHRAVFNQTLARIEMHLVSRQDQTVTVAGTPVAFARDEYIHTENSHKYTVDRFDALVRASGWRVGQHWTDTDGWFGVFLLQESKN